MRENKGYEDHGRMSIATPFHGSLFANDFLRDSVTHLDDWRNISAANLDILESSVRNVFNGFPSSGSPNESQTEDDLVGLIIKETIGPLVRLSMDIRAEIFNQERGT